MATRKKKIEISEVSDLPNVVKGTHLTVITYKDGRTELQWDDEQLLKEVREAIAKSELSQLKPSVKAKSNKKVPEAMKRESQKKTSIKAKA